MITNKNDQLEEQKIMRDVDQMHNEDMILSSQIVAEILKTIS